MSQCGSKVRISEKGPAIWCPACGHAHVFNSAATPTSNGSSWSWNGDGDAPTFSPSMHVRAGEWIGPDPATREDAANEANWKYRTVCHSFVTDGRIMFLADCEHSMKGTTVPVPDWPAKAINV